MACSTAVRTHTVKNIFEVSFDNGEGLSEEKKEEMRASVEARLPGKSISELSKQLSKNPNHRALLEEANKNIGNALETAEGITFSSLRLKAGLTQSELADKSGVKQYQISKLETGHGISLPNFKKIYKALNVSGDIFINAIRDRENESL